MTALDVVVIGAGPNGLAAAITLARAGLSVEVHEAADRIGGGTRTAELTLPGFQHDVCSAVHPLAAGSPFLRSVPLEQLGCELIHPELPLAHPLADGRAAVLERSVEATAVGLEGDGRAWSRLFGPLVDRWDQIGDALLAPLVRPPRHPLALARFGLPAVRSARHLASRFEDDTTRGLVAGLAGHGFLPLDAPLTASFSLVLGSLAHVRGWPFVRGGSQALADALGRHLVDLGGTIVTGHLVRSLDELPRSRAVVADVTPAQLLSLAGDRTDARARARMQRFRYGPGACKVDFALSGPVPWASPEARRAGTIHLGGTFEEIARSEHEVASGRHAEQPYVLVAQPSLHDPTRAPAGQHTLWAYCHVPNGSDRDVSDAITAQIERFAPGFRDLVLASSTITASSFEAYNPSYVGGDISGGSHAGTRLLLRPWPSLHPYQTPIDDVFLCSGSTPPGGGVHGMCGHHAALAVIRHLRRRA